MEHMTISEMVWVKYDNLPDKQRFITFMAFVGMPFALCSINPLSFAIATIFYGGCLVWRHRTMKNYHNKS